MKLLDIFYLDGPRLISLTSQRHSGIAESVTHTTTSSEATEKSIKEFTGSAVDNSYDRQVQDAVQIRIHDHALTSFMQSVHADIMNLDAVTVREQTERAIQAGGLVCVRGKLFVDDSQWLQENLKTIVDFYSHKEKLDKVQSDQAAKISSVLLQSAKSQARSPEQKTQLKNLEKQTEAQLHALSQAPTISAQYDLFLQMLSAFWQNSLECGVSLETPGLSTFVRAPLDRKFLRENMSTFVDRYGTRSSVDFVLLGTVSRLGWQGEHYLNEGEKMAANAVSLGTAAAGSQAIANNSNDPRQAAWFAQSVVVKMRRLVTAGHDKDSIFLSPLALYREIPVTDPTVIR